MKVIEQTFMLFNRGCGCDKLYEVKERKKKNIKLLGLT